MKNSMKNQLTYEELKRCSFFKESRLRYHMNQKDWARALKISYSLVKRIEEHTIRCSPSTMKKLQSYLQSSPVVTSSPVLHGLDERILYDTFLTYIIETSDMDNNEAAKCAAHCGKLVKRLLSNASNCKSPDTQEIYINYMEQLLTILCIAADDAVQSINNGENILNSKIGLGSVFTNSLITRFQKSNDILISKNGDVSIQLSLNDMF